MRSQSKRSQQRREQFRSDHSDQTPFEGFGEHQSRLTASIREAVNLQSLPSWFAVKGRKPIPLTIDDLAIGLFAVERTGKTGLSIGQLQLAHLRATGVKCHRVKASAILKSLIDLNIIRLTKKYVKGKRGRCYEVRPMSDAQVDGAFVEMFGTTDGAPSVVKRTNSEKSRKT